MGGGKKILQVTWKRGDKIPGFLPLSCSFSISHRASGKCPSNAEQAWDAGGRCSGQTTCASFTLHPSPGPHTSPSGTLMLPSSLMEKRNPGLQIPLLTWEVLARSPTTAPVLSRLGPDHQYHYGNSGKSQPLQTLFSSPALLLAVCSEGVHSWVDDCENPQAEEAMHGSKTSPSLKPPTLTQHNCPTSPEMPCLSYNAGAPPLFFL